MEEKNKNLRNLIENEKPIIVPGCIDAFSAKMVEKSGFHANYLSGNGASASILGQPDIGLMTMSQMTTICGNIVKATKIPLIADADTGYGNALNVIRTVQELETVGVSCIQLEDQVTPKRCGHFPGSKPVVSIDEQLGKLKAALDTRRDENLLIIARTDAAADHGIEEAIKRAILFEEVGADLTFIEIEGDAEDFENISRNVPGKYATTIDESRKEPAFSVEELGKMGFKLIIFPGIIRCTYLKSISEILDTLREENSVKSKSHLMSTFSEYNELLGKESFDKLTEKYL
ncbi:MAG: isocitrate lyase/PEP mutase family protein [Nitrospinota bacterium]|nr:isocitrate lyase/PEP mutase family protein [Nitrospinota bacterium]